MSNLESLCEEKTTGDLFDSEAEHVRVCPGMVGGEEHVFQQQLNGVKPTESASAIHSDHESYDVTHSDRNISGITHSDRESTWIMQTDRESNGVTQ